jgi:hypothetical protein
MSRRSDVIDRVFTHLVRTRFSDLPKTHQLAIVRYMAIEGEVWPPPAPDISLVAALSDYTDQFGFLAFGVVTIPMGILKRAVVQASDFDFRQAFGTNFAAYHRWYMKDIIAVEPRRHRRGPPRRTHAVWPVILNPISYAKRGNELLQDGWHRLHHYVDWGLKAVPAIAFYPHVRYFKDRFRM